MAMSMATLALTLAGVGTGVQVVSQVKAGRSAAKAGERAQASAESQAQLAEYNAQVAVLQAQDALARGAHDEHRFRMQVRGLIGSQRAGFAGANVDVGFGSAVDVQADAAFLGELDALQIRTNAAREAWGYQVQAEDYRRRAEITRKEGANAAAAGRESRSAAVIGATGTVIGGTSSLLQMRYGMGGRA